MNGHFQYLCSAGFRPSETQRQSSMYVQRFNERPKPIIELSPLEVGISSG